MIKVTQAAIKQIKEELKEIATDVKEPYIRLYMALG